MRNGFPLSKAADVAGDQVALTDEHQLLAQCPDVLNKQHAIREWEYAMGLLAIRHWVGKDLCSSTPRWPDLEIIDVGGAGSNYWQALRHCTGGDVPILVVDVNAPDRIWRDGEPVQYWRETIDQFAGHVTHGQFDVLTCISVIEHVKQPDIRRFLRACHMLLRPGGLLFLTTDYTSSEGPDVFHFHWMRERIYNAESLQKLANSAREIGFCRFGTADWTWHGPQVYDYSVASLALTKKE